MLSLFWKRFNFAGAAAGIALGGLTDILWAMFLSETGIYEIVPASIVSIIAAVAVTLMTKEPSKDIKELFDKAISSKA